jgi:hypothetical protein
MCQGINAPGRLTLFHAERSFRFSGGGPPFTHWPVRPDQAVSGPKRQEAAKRQRIPPATSSVRAWHLGDCLCVHTPAQLNQVCPAARLLLGAHAQRAASSSQLLRHLHGMPPLPLQVNDSQ